MKFHTRGFISFLTVWSFIILAASGVVMYIMPHGRVAYWMNWKLWGLTKDGWGAVHTISGYMFVLVAAAHFALNFHAFRSYIVSRVRRGLGLRRELAASLVIMMVILTGTVGGKPPFVTVMNIGALLKASWEKDIEQAPIPHAELMTIEQLSRRMGITVESAHESLRAHGVQTIDPQETIKSLAARSRISPADVYKIITPQGGGGGMKRGGGMRGRVWQ